MPEYNSNLALLVLKTGENLMGAIFSQDEDEIFLENVVAFAPKADGSGIMTIPYLQFSVENVTRFSLFEDVRHILTPNADLTAYHKKQFDTTPEIIVPDNKLITPKMTGVD